MWCGACSIACAIAPREAPPPAANSRPVFSLTSASAPVPPSAPSRPIPRKLIEHAVMLIGREQHGEPAQADAARQELQQWRAADALHESAFRTATCYWQSTQANALKESVPLPARAAGRASAELSRRRALTTLGVAGLALVGAAAGRWAWLQPVDQIALHTGHGQMLSHKLADGSQVDLAPHTVARVTYYRGRREVVLTRGDMRFDVRSQPDRPFSVTTPWGRVQVLGTVFDVAVRDGRMRVEVAEGRVAVWAGQWDEIARAGETPPGVVLEAGQGVEADTLGLGTRTLLRAESVGAWRNGWLVFNGTPLSDAIARWNDYLDRPARLGNQASLQAMRLTGSFPIKEPGAFFHGLPDMLPVRVTTTDSEILVDTVR